MDILRLGACAYSVYITNNELREMGVTPASVGRRDVLKLLPEPVPEPRLELWSGAGGVLIFVRGSREPERFAFSSLEGLLGAVAELPDGPSRLWLYNGEYVLEVFSPSRASEYGGKTDFREEYAKLLMDENAVSTLRNIFLQNIL